jgi:hypothetical protein
LPEIFWIDHAGIPSETNPWRPVMFRESRIPPSKGMVLTAIPSVVEASPSQYTFDPQRGRRHDTPSMLMYDQRRKPEPAPGLVHWLFGRDGNLHSVMDNICPLKLSVRLGCAGAFFPPMSKRTCASDGLRPHPPFVDRIWGTFGRFTREFVTPDSARFSTLNERGH